MPKIVMEEYEEFPILPVDSIIGVKVDAIDISTVPGRKPGTEWEKAEFTFKITMVPPSLGEEFQKLEGQRIWGSVPFRFNESPDNKLRQWVEAILGMELSVGFELDTDLLIGRECRAVIRNYDKKAINPRTGKPFQQHGVESLLAKGGQGVAAPQQVSAPAATDPWAASPVSEPAPF